MAAGAWRAAAGLNAVAMGRPKAPTVRDVVRAYYVVAGLYTLSASVIWGVATLFLLEAGLSFFEVFAANAAYSAGTVVFEVPTGVVADTLGRRVSFLASVAVLGVGTAAYVGLAALGAGVVAFAGVSVVLALGFTFYTGAVEAWLVDALTEVGFVGDLDGVFARGQQVTGVAMLAGTVGGGALGALDLALPFVVRVVLLVVVFVVAHRRMHDIGFAPRHVGWREVPRLAVSTTRGAVQEVSVSASLRLLVVAGVVQGSIFTWVFYAWQPYLLDLLDERRIWVAGLVAAGVAMSTIVGNQVVRQVGTGFRRSTLLIVSGMAQSASAVGVGMAPNFAAAVVALFAFSVAVGITGPVRQAYVHRLVAPARRATVVSVDSLLAGVGSTGGQLGLGALGQAQGVGAAFVAGGAVTSLAVPVLLRLRRVDDPVDRAGGPRVEERPASCAAEGIPGTAQVRPQRPATVGGSPGATMR